MKNFVREAFWGEIYSLSESEYSDMQSWGLEIQPDHEGIQTNLLYEIIKTFQISYLHSCAISWLEAFDESQCFMEDKL